MENSYLNLNPMFLRSMEELLGEKQAADLREALASTPPVTAVRLNPLKKSSLKWDGDPVPWCSGGTILHDRPRFTFIPQLHSGAFYVQEPASMMVGEIIRKIAPERPLAVLDLCAAPGGKTTAAVAALPAGSLMTANEFIPQRAVVLRENIQKWGHPAVTVTNSPTAAFASVGPAFDIVIADAPCSGEGMMRKDPEARAQWTPGLVEKCSALQRTILADAVAALAPGGYLIYSTCTFNRLENEENVAWAINNFGLESIEISIDPGWGIHPAIGSSHHCMRFFPHLTPSEGLFISVMRKTDGEKARLRVPKSKIKKADQSSNIKIPWINQSTHMDLIAGDESVFAIPEEWHHLSIAIGSSAKVIYPGTEVAEIRGKDIIPAHPTVLSTLFIPDSFPSVELGIPAVSMPGKHFPPMRAERNSDPDIRLATPRENQKPRQQSQQPLP